MGRIQSPTRPAGRPAASYGPQKTEEEEEDKEGLFKANAVNEEDPERYRATQV